MANSLSASLHALLNISTQIHTNTRTLHPQAAFERIEALQQAHPHQQRPSHPAVGAAHAHTSCTDEGKKGGDHRMKRSMVEGVHEEYGTVTQPALLFLCNTLSTETIVLSGSSREKKLSRLNCRPGSSSTTKARQGKR